MPKNNAKTWFVISLLLVLVGIALSVAGFTADSSELIGLVAVGLMLSITFLICFFIFLSQAKRLDRMFQKEEIFAHWQFDPTEQLQKAEEEYRTKKAANRTLLIVILIFFGLIGGGFALFGFDDIEGAVPFLLILLGALAIICTAALSAPRATYNRMMRSVPEVFVGPSGAWVMGVFTMWRAPMTRIDYVVFDQSASGTMIAVHYRTRQRYGWQRRVCRIPVPRGREQEAYAAAVSIASASGVEFQIASVAGPA